MSVRAGLQNFKVEISRWGLRKALARDLWVALERVVGLHLYRVQSGGRIRPPLTGDQRVEIPEDCSVRIVDHETIARFAEDPEYDISPGFVQFCVANGHQFWGLFIRDRLVHYMVRGRGLAPGEKELVIRIDPEFDYDYKSFTLPEVRGRGYPKMRSQVMRDGYGGREVRPVISYISVHNYPSLRANDKEGGQEIIGYAGYWRIFGRWWFLRSRKVRMRGLAFDLPTVEETQALERI
ncbi:MAG: hypothetical protein P8M78_06695 [Myxococcota bacterium]|nr:hypothetical protein [Myxococcota bacterium]